MVRLEDILKLMLLDEKITLYDADKNVYIMNSEFKDLILSKYYNWFVVNLGLGYNNYGHKEIVIVICEPCEKE